MTAIGLNFDGAEYSTILNFEFFMVLHVLAGRVTVRGVSCLGRPRVTGSSTQHATTDNQHKEWNGRAVIMTRVH